VKPVKHKEFMVSYVLDVCIVFDVCMMPFVLTSVGL